MELIENIGSFIFHTRHKEKPVEKGCIYEHAALNGSTETARVLNITSDYQGIKHVSFEVVVKRSTCSPYLDRRILSLDTFTKRYS